MLPDELPCLWAEYFADGPVWAYPPGTHQKAIRCGPDILRKGWIRTIRPQEAENFQTPY